MSAVELININLGEIDLTGMHILRNGIIGVIDELNTGDKNFIERNYKGKRIVKVALNQQTDDYILIDDSKVRPYMVGHSFGMKNAKRKKKNKNTKKKSRSKSKKSKRYRRSR